MPAKTLSSSRTSKRNAVHTNVDDAAIITAENLLSSSNEFVREAGAQALSGITDSRALRILTKALNDDQERVVRAALRALVETLSSKNDTPSEVVLLKAITDDTSKARTILLGDLMDLLGTQLSTNYQVLQIKFYAENPDLAVSRLKDLENGSFQRVQSSRSFLLKHDTAFGALFDAVRNNPDLRNSLLEYLERKTEFIMAGNLPGTLEPFWKDIRRMTGLFTALTTDTRLQDMLDLTIDKSIARRSKRLWEEIKKNNLYVPEVVIGAGPHAANFCSTLSTLRPDFFPVCIERRGRIGGQFAITPNAAWTMNSRSRPIAEDRDSTPGNENALNTLGSYATLQEADVTGQTYATQDRVSAATRVDLFLTCNPLIYTEYQGYEKSSTALRLKLKLPTEEEMPAKYVITLKNNVSQEVGYILTDFVFIIGGLGEPNCAFPKEKKAIHEALEKENASELPRYMNGDSFMTWFYNPARSFPLRGIKNAIIVGDGDYAKVVAEALLGLGPNAGRTVNQLDRVKTITWVGQQSETREVFLTCERARYHGLAEEFPRNDKSTKNPRIIPIKNKAAKINFSDSGVSIVTGKGATITGDCVIDCTGFTSSVNIDLPLSEVPFADKLQSPLEVSDQRGKTAKVSFSDFGGPYRVSEFYVNIKIVGLLENSSYNETTGSGSFTKTNWPEILNNCLCDSFFQKDSKLTFKSYDKEKFVSQVDNESVTIGMRDLNENIFYLGPIAGLPLTNNLPTRALSIGENVVAVWRYSNLVTAAAEMYYANLANLLPQHCVELQGRLIESSPMKLSEASTKAIRFSSINTSLPVNQFATTVDKKTLLVHACADHLRRYSPHISEGKIRLIASSQFLTNQSSVATLQGVALQAEQSLDRSLDLQPLIDGLVSDPTFAQIIVSWTGRVTASGRPVPSKVIIEEPIQNRRFCSDDITIAVKSTR